MHTAAVVSSSSSQRRRSHSCSLPHSRSARRPRGGAQARDISDGRAVPGLSSSSAAPPPASCQSPRALASGSPHTARRPCVRPYRLRWTIDGSWPRRLRCTPRAAGGQRELAAAAAPRRSRRFGTAFAPKRSVTRPLNASAR
jgi:hypothetical protein